MVHVVALARFLRLESLIEVERRESSIPVLEFVASVCVLLSVASLGAILFLSTPAFLRRIEIEHIDDAGVSVREVLNRTLTEVRLLRPSEATEIGIGAQSSSPLDKGTACGDVDVDFEFDADEFCGRVLFSDIGLPGSATEGPNGEPFANVAAQFGELGSIPSSTLFICPGNKRSVKETDSTQNGPYAGALMFSRNSGTFPSDCLLDLGDIFFFRARRGFKKGDFDNEGRTKQFGLRLAERIQFAPDTVLVLELRWKEERPMLSRLFESSFELQVEREDRIPFGSSLDNYFLQNFPNIESQATGLSVGSQLGGIVVFSVLPEIMVEGRMNGFLLTIALIGGLFNVVVAMFAILLFCVRLSRSRFTLPCTRCCRRGEPPLARPSRSQRSKDSNVASRISLMYEEFTS